MCLSEVESIVRKPQAKGAGWKVFEVNDDDSLKSEIQGGDREMGVWLISDGHFDNYPLGFHVFTNRKAATKWKKACPRNLPTDLPGVIKKVLWRDQLAIGRQDCWYTNQRCSSPW